MKYSSFCTGLIASVLVLVSVSFADRPAKEELRERVPVKEVPQAQAQALPASVCNSRLSAGYALWFLKEEDSTGAPAAYFDFWCSDVPVNFRVGIEGRHMDISQGDVAKLAEAPGEAVETSYIRIPFALEYYSDLGDGLTGYVGIGPDIINMNNDFSDTSVGFHLGTRVHYAFDQNWGVSLEAGYMWGELSDQDVDVNLDGWYLTPAVAYTF